MKVRLSSSPLSAFRAQHHGSLQRGFTTFFPLCSNPSPSSQASNSRWLSLTQARIGKCIMFGMSREQSAKAAGVLKILAAEWRDFVAGREGFLVDKKRAGLIGQRVVWGEMDVMNHVNNVTYIRYAESARINWAYNYAIHHDPSNRTSWSELWTPRGDGLILRSMKTDYKFPMTWPDKISVFHKLRYLPKPEDTSFVLDVVILSEGQRRVAARCEEDIVVYDYKRGEKIAIREFMMRAFEKTWRDQREEEERVRRRVEEVEGVVRELERGCWDKEGAVEDMGGGR